MRARYAVMIAVGAVCAASLSAQAAGGAAPTVCPEGPGAYQGRTVSDVQVTSPFDFIEAVKAVLERARQTVPLAKGDSFDVSAYTSGMEGIARYIRALFPSSLISFRVVAVSGALENCTASTVQVHYSVFTAVIPRSSADVLELARGLVDKPSGTAGGVSASGFLKVLPNVNYNQTRHLFGGLAIDQAVPLKIFDRIVADPEVSSDSTTGTISLTGSANPAKKYLNQANWILGTQYYDVPVNSASVTKGLLSAQAFGSTKELRQAITLRAGGEMGGGHVQDGTADTPDSSYGEIKLLAGMEAHRGDITGSASYGFEAGKRISNSAGIFEKHVFDARLAWTFAPLPSFDPSNPKGTDDRVGFIGKPHYPLSIEAQANGGLITSAADAPSAERFFGGNQADPFIPGQPWDALGQPFIRSIAENRLGAATGTNAIGGDHFYSANLTVTKAVWGRALVPSELGSQEFLDHLDGGIKTAKGFLSDHYYSQDPTVSGMADAVVAIGKALADLKSNIPGWQGKLNNFPNVKPIFTDLHSHLLRATMGVNAIKRGGTIGMPLLIDTSVPAVVGDLKRLGNAAKAAGDIEFAEAIQKCQSAVDGELNALTTNWNKLDTKGARWRADQHANADFAPAENVLNSLLYTLDKYSVSAVGVFDVARVFPEQSGMRFGPGAGVRLSIVNANFTFGYAYNPRRPEHENAGAFFFKLDFTDLFR